MVIDSSRLEYLLQNVGDIAFKRRVTTIVRGLEIQDQDKILDCGCGEGFYLKIISDLSSCRLYGFDRDEQALNRARQELDGSQVRFDQGDIYDLPYQDEEFDKVILSEVLEHLPDDVNALTEVKRVLKPGGILFITVPNRNYPFLWDPINKTLEAFFGTHIKNGFWAGIWNMHMRLYTVNEIVKVAKEVDLEIVSLEALTHYCTPFNHLFIHGMKRLLNTGALPKTLSIAADKFTYRENKRSSMNPVTLGYMLFNFIDRLNDNVSENKSSVAIGIKAIKQR
jgi:ubiquinone/menaquinone biosynthesis C-methylase UbiE